MIIYKVTNKINGKIYIGQTVKSVVSRKAIHYYASKSSNDGSVFHKALVKYKGTDFDWESV